MYGFDVEAMYSASVKKSAPSMVSSVPVQSPDTSMVKSDAEPPITDIGLESESGPEAVRLVVATDETVFSPVTYVSCPVVRSVLVPSLLLN